MSPMLTAKQVAEELGIDPATVRDWCKNGTLDAIDVSARPGGRATWRIEREALERFKNSRRSVPAPKRPPRQRRPAADVPQIF